MVCNKVRNNKSKHLIKRAHFSSSLSFVQYKQDPTIQRCHAWRALPVVSEWVMNTIVNGYTLQFSTQTTPLLWHDAVSGARSACIYFASRDSVSPGVAGDRGSATKAQGRWSI